MNTIGEKETREVVPQVESPEAHVEVQEQTGVSETREQKQSRVEKSAQEAAPIQALVQYIAPVTQQTKDPVLKRVEEILEEDMGEAYVSLSPADKVKFKKRGEEVAGIVWQMVTSAKVQAKKVLRLIISWFRIIPHVNRFFLEQEAKIKTDRIVTLAGKKK